MNPEQFISLIIKPTLKKLAEYNPAMLSQEAADLLLCTAAHESHLGEYIKQVNGPALGVYQIEPATNKSLWDDFILVPSRRNFAQMMYSELPTSSKYPYADQLMTNLTYQTIMARLKYWIAPEPIPKLGLHSLADYWGKYYQSTSDPAKIEKFIKDAKIYAKYN